MDRLLVALKAALRCGLTPDEFWRTTPFLLSLRIKAKSDGDRDALRTQMIAQWFGAVWSRARTIPSLDDALKVLSEPQAPVAKTPEQLARIAKEFTERMGGTVTIAQEEGGNDN